MSEEFSISSSVEAELTAEFWAGFSSYVGYSLKTGYNWTQVSTQTESEQITVTVTATVLPGIDGLN